MMDPLRLRPLPSTRANDESGLLLMEREGFVDEAVVAALLNIPTVARSVPCPADLALAVDDLDFAGWQVSAARQKRAAEVPPQVIAAIVRRATPPVSGEPGIGAPHHGSHRWWLAGLAGALCTLLASALLLTLSTRSGARFETLLPPGTRTSAKPLPPRTADPLKVAVELTAASTRRP